MPRQAEGFLRVLQFIKQTLWMVYFTVFNIFYFATMFLPIVIVSAVLLFLMPEPPYMLYLLLGTAAVLSLVIPFFKFFSVRARFGKRLRKVCAQSGYTLRLRRTFFVALVRPTGKVDFTVTTPKTVFEVSLLPSRSRFEAVELSPDMSSFCRRSRIGFSPLKHVTRRGQVIRAKGAAVTSSLPKRHRPLAMDNSDMKAKSNLISRKTRRIILFSPVPGEIRLAGDHGSYRTVENGEGKGDRAIYSGSGFVNMLDRLCRDPE